MRERLIELLDGAASTQYEGDAIVVPEMDIDDEDINRIADYLLANGVIAPPCRLGDTVYEIGRNVIEEHKIEKIEIVAAGKMYLFYDWRGCAYKIKSIGEIGTTVFLSKEDAEAAIRRRERE